MTAQKHVVFLRFDVFYEFFPKFSKNLDLKKLLKISMLILETGSFHGLRKLPLNMTV